MAKEIKRTARHFMMAALWATAGVAVVASNKQLGPKVQSTANAAVVTIQSDDIEGAVELAERLDFNPAQAPIAPGPLPKETVLPKILLDEPVKTSAPKPPVEPMPAPPRSPASRLKLDSGAVSVERSEESTWQPTPETPAEVQRVKEELPIAELAVQSAQAGQTADCVAELQAVATQAIVTFTASSARVDSDGRDTVSVVASYIQGCPDARLTVEGLADRPADHNLAWDRAKTVTNILLAEGVAPGQLRTVLPTKAGADADAGRLIGFQVGQISG